MQRTGNFRSFGLALILATSFFGLFSRAARAQDPFASDAVLGQGNPPLTEGMVTRFTSFQGWLFEIPFTEQQRERIRAMLVEDWKKPEEIKNDLTWLSRADNFAAATPESREFMRVDLQARIVKDLRASKNNPDSQWWVTAYDAAHGPIAPGNPPLTESMVSHYATFLSWILEIPGESAVPLTNAVRNMLLEEWKNPVQVRKQMDFLNWQLDLARRSVEERDFTRIKAQADTITNLRAEKDNPVSRMLVAAYDAAHSAIAAGDPPLTRQAVDAFTDMLCFIQNQRADQRLDGNKALKDSYAQQFAQIYGTLPLEQRKKLAAMPQTWAGLRLAWANYSEADRQKMRAQWTPAGQSEPAADPLGEATAVAIAGRVNAFLKRDPNTVSEQEVLEAARDADTVARYARQAGVQQNLAVLAGWEKLGRTLHGGKQVYLNQVAIDQATAQTYTTILMNNMIRHSMNRLNTTLNTMDGTQSR